MVLDLMHVEVFLLSDGSWIGKNKVILASDLCSSLQIDNTKKKRSSFFV